jgi:raffinose/stachyose/melibiose transport system substrate-binding protein
VAIILIVAIIVGSLYYAGYFGPGASPSPSPSQSPSPSPVTLSFWVPFAGEYGEDDFWSNATSAYHTQTGTTVTVSMYSGDNYFTKITTALGSGAPPDLFTTYGGGELDTYVTDNAVASLSSLFTESWATSQIGANAKAAVTRNGTQYAIPYELQSDWMFINDVLFNKYNVPIPSITTGWTWDQFLSACATFKANSIYPVAMSGGNTWALTFPECYMFERTNGPTAFTDALARKTNFTNFYNLTDTVIQQWVNDNDFQPGWKIADFASDALPLFQDGQAAMWIQGTWGVGMTVDNASTFKLDVAPWPYFANNPSANGYIFGEYTSFAVAAASKHAAQAEDFLRFISQPQWISKYVQMTTNPVAQNVTMPANAYPPAMLKIQTAISNAPSLLIRFGTLAPPALSATLDTQNLLVFTGQTTPSSAAITIEATAVDVLGPVTG